MASYTTYKERQFHTSGGVHDPREETGSEIWVSEVHVGGGTGGVGGSEERYSQSYEVLKGRGEEGSGRRGRKRMGVERKVSFSFSDVVIYSRHHVVI